MARLCADREAGMQFVPQKEGKRKKSGYPHRQAAPLLFHINSKQTPLQQKDAQEQETESHVEKGNQSCDAIMNGKSAPPACQTLSTHAYRRCPVSRNHQAKGHGNRMIAFLPAIKGRVCTPTPERGTSCSHVDTSATGSNKG